MSGIRHGIDWLEINTSGLVLVLAIHLLSAFGIPSHDENNQKSYHAAEQVSDDLSWWKSSAVWTAIFTGLLTVSTIGLWGVTRTAANAARDAAEALPLAERAYVFFNNAKCPDIEQGDLTLGDATQTIFTVNYSFKNHGRTPAIVWNVQVDAIYLATGQPEAKDLSKDTLPTALIVSKEDDIRQHSHAFPILGADFENAKVGNGHIFFYGILSYRDVFMREHETGVCGEWNFTARRFVVTRDSNLNYQT